MLETGARLKMLHLVQVNSSIFHVASHRPALLVQETFLQRRKVAPLWTKHTTQGLEAAQQGIMRMGGLAIVC